MVWRVTVTRAQQVAAARDLVDGPPLVELWPTAGMCLGIARRNAYVMAARGSFPVEALRVNGRWRCRRSDLMAFLGVSESGGAK